MRRGVRVVHGDKELVEKLGHNDLCRCGSSKRFQEVLHAVGPVLTARTAIITYGENYSAGAGRAPADSTCGGRQRR